MTAAVKAFGVLCLYCHEFCCQPEDGVGNPTCWDIGGHYSYERCCSDNPPPQPLIPPLMRLGSLLLPLYRGPVDHNQPRFTERTVEVAIGLWYMRRTLDLIFAEGGGYVPIEIGNVLGQYWPPEERIEGRYLPWRVLDLSDNGIDATRIKDFRGQRVLTISTLEHIGYDNMGTAQTAGFYISRSSIEAWVRSWDQGARFLARLIRESREFVVTFPLGFNPRLDAVVSRTPDYRGFVRVVRRIDAENRWEMAPNGSFQYFYDFRDTYDSNHVGLIYDSKIPTIYRDIYGDEMPELLPLPAHPRFRFANAICIVTNVPELLT